MSSGNRREYPKIAIGTESRIEKIVPPEWTISAYDPRLPSVFSTPAMIGMMEVAAAKAVQPHLPAEMITVGTRIEVDHLKAAPVGALVYATARLVSQDGRLLIFDVEAGTGGIIIGRGRVFRAVVEPKSFGANASARTSS
ncbi:MAG: hotdog domain-containing protein [Candidatus Acidiferrales bacterium]